MFRLFNHYVAIHNLMLAVIDVAVLMLSIYAGLFLRWADIESPLPAIAAHLPGAIIFTAILLLTFFAVGLYRNEAWRNWTTMLARIVVGFSIAIMLEAALVYFVPALNIWRSSLVIAVVLAIALMMLVRAVFWSIVSGHRIKRRVVVLGTGEQAARIEALQRNGNGRGLFDCLGYLRVNGLPNRVPASRRITGVNNLADYVRLRDIDEFVIAAENHRDALPIDELIECQRFGTKITDYLTFYERETGRVDLESLHLGGLHPSWAIGGIHPSWLVFSGAQGGGQVYLATKRIFDITFALAFLIFMLPLLVATALAIRLDSRGPILYRQERIGSGGRAFMLLKFRSMVAHAEADGVPKWADQEDPRVTRVGRFIRRTRIDEIPQMINVLKGDMSLVGPRPERAFFVEQLGARIPFYGERHRIKPGVTGWAQINYQYAASAGDAKVKTEFDLYYIKNQGFFLDLIVVLGTLRVIIWPASVT